MALAREETYGSMSCVKASRPVLAVIAGGIRSQFRVDNGDRAVASSVCEDLP